jgi:molybdopterin-guanine dinucleotide biosynthesis protein MobB
MISGCVDLPGRVHLFTAGTLPERCMVRVIPVTGLSGSGKTTFIQALIPLLSRLGPVGTVKHIGHHTLELPEGKDTTVMFGAGSGAAVGIDQEKMLITLDSTSLAEALDILSGRGIAFAVVEGYKGGPLPKIALGDAEIEGCILRNPEPEEVIRSLDRFPSYFTLGEILKDLGEDCRTRNLPFSLTASVSNLPSGPGGDIPVDLGKAFQGIAETVKDSPGAVAVRIAIQHGSPLGRPDQLLVGIAAENGEAAAAALGQVLRLSLDLLEKRGIRPR